MNIDEIKNYTDPLYSGFANVENADGDVGEIYKTLISNGIVEQEAKLRTLVFIYRKATKEGIFYRSYSIWGEAQWSSPQ